MGRCREETVVFTYRSGLFVRCVRAIAFVLALAEVPAESGEPAGYTPVADIMEALPGEDHSSLTVRGVVTLKVGEGLVMQDDTAGIWIDVTQSRRTGLLETELVEVVALHEGDIIEVNGRAKRGGYAPTIVPTSLRKVGEGPLPPPRSYDRNRFFLGLEDCLRVEVSGIVRGFRENTDNSRWLILVTDVTRQFWVDVAKEMLVLPPDRYVDASVRCTGVATGDFNSRGELFAPRLSVCPLDDFSIETPPGEVRDVPLAEIGRYPDTGHSVRTQGIVTYSVPGSFLYLQEGCQGVLVESNSMESLAEGDRVDVVGFLDGTQPVFGITEASVTRTRAGVPIEPVAIHPAEIVRINAVALSRYDTADPGDYYGCLVTFPATVVDVSPGRRGGEVRLLADDVGITAISGLLGLIKSRLLEPGSRVQVTGIVRPVVGAPRQTTTAERPAAAPPLEILLRSPDDLKLLQSPSWWKPQRLAALIAVLFATVLVTLGWAWLLRRQVAHHVRVIEEKLQFEAIAGERLRIAREFHDTLEQDLASISLRLDAAADFAGDAGSRSVLEQQRGLLEQVRRETHDFLWDLRDPARTDGDLVTSVAAQIAYFQTLTHVPVVVSMEPDAVRVSPIAQFHLLRLVREAVANALKHAAPTRVDVRVHATESGYAIDVEDDGRGFDVTTHATLDGHFGLRGMAERALRMGAQLSIDSVPGRGTRVRVVIPVEIPAVRS